MGGESSKNTKSADEPDVGPSKKRKKCIHRSDDEEDVGSSKKRKVVTKKKKMCDQSDLKGQRDSRDDDHYRDGLGDNGFEKDDISMAGDRMGDHLADKDKNSKIDDLFGPFDVVDGGLKEGDHVRDDTVDECVKISDDVGDNAGKISGNEVD
ncbi:hypothetical protein K7X08_024154 [Anisodus acutangulus]|uniref:Uncharacterized protein n=1 Tax=Anisodus acutangulus TaxID=402998 RepID=A0A9Q1RCN6_9SOLA|nr:hypothetical protein K7X08_024154 [Anisodus acutangulus]